MSATWQGLWDENHLYFHVEVTDDVLQTPEGGSPWHDDIVEIYVDGDNSRGSFYDGNDFQFGFRYGETPEVVHTGNNSAPFDPAQIDYEFVATATGYRLEVAIPWTEIGVTVASGSKIGVDVHVGDDDNGGGRDAKIEWADGTDNAFQDPSLFGLATLTGNENAVPVATADNYTLDENTTFDTSTLWHDASWGARQRLTFDNLSRGENLTDFTVLVELNASNIDYAKTQNNGEDLRFYDADGTLLDHEIETWDESGSSFVWVRVPQIDGYSDTDFIWMYYDNAAAPDGSNVAGTWSNNYQAVYHLNETTSGSGVINDATGNYDATNSGAVAANGRVGGGLEFDGNNDFVDVGTDVDILNGVGAVTLSAWVETDGTSNSVIVAVAENNGGTPTIASRASLGIYDNEYYSVARSADGETTQLAETIGELAVDQWQYVTTVIDYAANTIDIYVDGQLSVSQSVSFSQNTASNTNSERAVIGAQDDVGSEFFDGVLDEIKIADTIRSADWISAEYASMTGALVSFSGEQTNAGVLANDYDPNGDTLQATVVTGPNSAASFFFNSDGSFTYTPTPEFSGTDSFTYVANDGMDDSDETTVTLTINNINYPPTIALANTITSLSESTNTAAPIKVADIILTDDGDGTNTFTMSGADAGFFQVVSVSNVHELYLQAGALLDYESQTQLDVVVEVDDTAVGTSPDDTASLTITLIDENDTAPTIGGNQVFTIAEDASALTPLGTVTASDLDTVGTLQGWTIVAGNSQGIFGIDSVSGELFIADPTNLNFESDPFHYVSVTVSDGIHASASTSVRINVTDVDEVPIAVNDAATTDEDTVLSVSVAGILANDVDQDRFVTPPTPGETLYYDATHDTNGNATWENFYGTGAFHWSFAGGMARTLSPTSAPAGIDAAWDFDGTGGGTMASLLGLPGEQSSQAATFELWFNPEDTIDRDVIFETGSNSTGTSFVVDGSELQFHVVDANDSATLTYSGPDLVAGQYVHVAGVFAPNAGGADLSLYVNGVLVDTLATTIVDWSNGNSSGLGSSSNMAGAPASNFEGEIALVRYYEGILSATDIAQNYSAATTSLVVSEVEGQASGVGSWVTLASGALVRVEADGSYQYDPNGALDYLGDTSSTVDSFSYTVVDGTGMSATAQVDVTVDGVNDDPAVGDQTFFRRRGFKYWDLYWQRRCERRGHGRFS